MSTETFRKVKYAQSLKFLYPSFFVIASVAIESPLSYRPSGHSPRVERISSLNKIPTPPQSHTSLKNARKDVRLPPSSAWSYRAKPSGAVERISFINGIHSISFVSLISVGMTHAPHNRPLCHTDRAKASGAYLFLQIPAPPQSSIMSYRPRECNDRVERIPFSKSPRPHSRTLHYK